MDIKTFTVTVTPQNSVKLSTKNSDLFLDESELEKHFKMGIPPEKFGLRDPEVRNLIQNYVYDYENTLELKKFFQKKLNNPL